MYDFAILTTVTIINKLNLYDQNIGAKWGEHPELAKTSKRTDEKQENNVTASDIR